MTGPGRPPAGPPPGVHWLGWIEDAVLAAAYRGADALVFHSFNEGFGLPLLEAMSLGLPVVATSAGSIPEVAGPAALLVPPGDAAALADALRRVAEDKVLRSRLQMAGEHRAAEFSWDLSAARVLEIWAEVVRNPRPSSKTS